MNLERLKWTKSVTPQRGEPWAYEQFHCGKDFHLHWKANESNARRPQQGDLILLRQKGFVTHLVEVLDDEPKHEDWLGDFSIYRKVKTIRLRLAELSAIDVFDFPEILCWEGGNVKRLETASTFKQRWDGAGGLSAFHKHVAKKLNLA